MRRSLIVAISIATIVSSPQFALADSAQGDAGAAQPPAAAAAAPMEQTAPAAPVQTVPAHTADAADLDRVECRTGPPPTGTRLGGTRWCMTKREWNDRQQDTQREVTRAQIVPLTKY